MTKQNPTLSIAAQVSKTNKELQRRQQSQSPGGGDGAKQQGQKPGGSAGTSPKQMGSNFGLDVC